MSCYLVSETDIDTLVTAMIHNEIIGYSDATKTGQILWNENARSVTARYPKRPCEAPSYTHVARLRSIAVVTMKRIDHYEYQACEAPDYENSEAYILCCKLRSKLWRDIRDGYADLSAAWQRAPWGIEG